MHNFDPSKYVCVSATSAITTQANSTALESSVGVQSPSLQRQLTPSHASPSEECTSPFQKEVGQVDTKSTSHLEGKEGSITVCQSPLEQEREVTRVGDKKESGSTSYNGREAMDRGDNLELKNWVVVEVNKNSERDGSCYQVPGRACRVESHPEQDQRLNSNCEAARKGHEDLRCYREQSAEARTGHQFELYAISVIAFV